MTGAAPVGESDIFEGGPPLKLQARLGLIELGKPSVPRRTGLVILIGWAPLMVLVALQSIVRLDDGLALFLTDFGVHGRSLVAAPLFILAELVCIPRLGAIARHFRASGLVAAADQPRFDHALVSARRLCSSTLAEVVIFAIAYAIVSLILVTAPRDLLPSWQFIGNGEQASLSPAGWWHLVVSLPLVLVLFLGWLWRLFVWGRYLWTMASLELRLIPVHPDHAGGLLFVSASLPAFCVVAFAIATIVAGGLVNNVGMGLELQLFGYVSAGVAAAVVVVFSAPLLVFTRPLIQAWRRGTFAYGALAGGVGRQFERRWLDREAGVDGSALEAPDFSATTDLYQLVSNIYAIRLVPFARKPLLLLVIAALLPFLPVLLMIIPMRDVLLRLTHMLF